MSDDMKDFNDKLEAAALLEKKRREVQETELVVREHQAKVRLERIQRTKQEEEKAKHIDYGSIDHAYTSAVIRDNEEYILAAKNPMTFINEAFDGVVPFFRKNLIVVGGKTGEGKSTAVANIIVGVIREPNPITNAPRRILVLTNEEKAEDVYNRVTCLLKGWAYTNHDKFTPEQLKELNQGIQALSNSGRLKVIDDSYGGVPGTTTTLEGLMGVFESLLKNNQFFDAILIDYYQNIKASKNDPTLDQYKVQEMFSTMIDQYKNRYPAPIVVMAQVKPPDQADTPFNIRIKGSKSLPDRATLVLEMVAHRMDFKTEWIVHKSRFTEGLIGQGFFTGFEKGKFVLYDNAFMGKVLKWKEERTRRTMAKSNGLDKVFEENKDAEVQKKTS
jgi:hypothetical protein